LFSGQRGRFRRLPISVHTYIYYKHFFAACQQKFDFTAIHTRIFADMWIFQAILLKNPAESKKCKKIRKIS